MNNLDHTIFQLLLAKDTAAQSYHDAVQYYHRKHPHSKLELFDDVPSREVVVDDLILSDDVKKFTSTEVCDAVDRLEYQDKIVVTEVNGSSVIRIKPLGK